MSLKAEYEGDVMKAPGARLLVALNKADDAFIGFYAFTKAGTFLRAYRMWITASGQSLYQLNGSKLAVMDPKFIDSFDALDDSGRTPTNAEIAEGSTKG